MVIITLFIITLLLVSVYFNYRMISMVFYIEDQIKESFEILDESYEGISQILQIPVTSDDKFVKQVLAEIKKARKAVDLVEDRLTLKKKVRKENDSE
jgi:hypothetical protein